MAGAVMASNAVGFSSAQGLPRSSAFSGCESSVSWSSSALHFCGQRVATASDSPRESKSRGVNSGARAYASTAENIRTRFGQGAVTKNLYDILGVSKTATPREIKSAYRMAARRVHPDVVPEDRKIEATKGFVEVFETYSILSDHQSRAAYDLSLSLQSFQSAGFSNKDPVAYSNNGKEEFAFSSTTWGFTSSPNPSSDLYSSSSFSFKGRNWETDQCW